MRCGTAPTGHPRLYALPADTRVDWGGLAPWVRAADGSHLRCQQPDCTRAMRAVAVQGREGQLECGERCVAATGPACDCRCKGENHGGGEW